MAWLTLAFVAGVCVGVLIMCILRVGADSDEE